MIQYLFRGINAGYGDQILIAYGALSLALEDEAFQQPVRPLTMRKAANPPMIKKAIVTKTSEVYPKHSVWSRSLLTLVPGLRKYEIRQFK